MSKNVTVLDFGGIINKFFELKTDILIKNVTKCHGVFARGFPRGFLWASKYIVRGLPRVCQGFSLGLEILFCGCFCQVLDFEGIINKFFELKKRQLNKKYH